MAKKTARVLNMQKLLADILKTRFGLQIPEHFVRKHQVFTPGTAEEKLESVLIEFFTSYLDANIPPEQIAAEYKIPANEVVEIREKWAEKLSHYFD
jgi:hypothetical protein